MRIPDRLVLNANGLTIIDYKTGKPDAKHRQQLNEYASLLQEAGLSVHAKFLFYTTTKQKEEVL